MKTKRKYRGALLTAVVAVGFSTAALAQEKSEASAVTGVTVTPAKKQSAQQQQKDESECYANAAKQTGYEPAQASEPQKKSGVGKGAAVGGAVGTGVGIITGHPVRGAAVGAGAGAGGAAMKNKGQKQGAQEAQAQLQGAFNNSYANCLTDRGYSTKQ